MTHVGTIAEAVKSALNAATMPPTPTPTFNFAFVAKRVGVPVFDLATIGSALSVYVVAKLDQSEPTSRQQSKSEMTVEVAVIKRIESDPTTEAGNIELDPLMDLTRRISTFFDPREALGATESRWSNSSTTLVYDSQQMRENKVFFAVVTLAFDLPYNH